MATILSRPDHRAGARRVDRLRAVATLELGRRWAFDEFARSRGDFALAGVALFYDLDQGRAVEPHIAAIAIGATPVRLAVEQLPARRSISRRSARQLRQQPQALIPGRYPRPRRLPAGFAWRPARARFGPGSWPKTNRVRGDSLVSLSTASRSKSTSSRAPAWPMRSATILSSPGHISAVSTAYAGRAPSLLMVRRSAPV